MCQRHPLQQLWSQPHSSPTCGKYHTRACATGPAFPVPAGSSLVVSTHQRLQEHLSPPLPKASPAFPRTLGPAELQILGAPLCKSLQVKCTEGIKVLRCSVRQRPHSTSESQNGRETSDFLLATRVELRPPEGDQSPLHPTFLVLMVLSPYQGSCVHAQNYVHRDRAGQAAAAVIHPLG